MKINVLAGGVLAMALAMPLAAVAQNQPPAATQSYGHGHRHTTPSQAKLQHRWMKRFGRLNLSGDQQQRISGFINQFSQAHPEGSPSDRNANRELKRQLMSVLTPDQQNQYHQQMRERRAQMHQRHMQGGQYQGSPDQQQYQQGPADQQQYQQGPPDQQYQQGPPPNDQQGPPPNDQQGPPPGDQQGPPPPAS